MNQSNEVVRAKVAKYREEKLEPILKLALAGVSPQDVHVQKNIHIDALSFAINGALRGEMTTERRLDLVTQNIALMEAYAESLHLQVIENSSDSDKVN